uniref:Uncharacterized protein n=1 Tax=Marseillevirus LCMAC201 TaxID=2506605 RepID=A0A481YVC8_9VIRU|nr:MAG: hypothetical protein LCMAC201_00600 [Marseillevirus LCMAC201]
MELALSIEAANGSHQVVDLSTDPRFSRTHFDDETGTFAASKNVIETFVYFL